MYTSVLLLQKLCLLKGKTAGLSLCNLVPVSSNWTRADAVRYLTLTVSVPPAHYLRFVFLFFTWKKNLSTARFELGAQTDRTNTTRYSSHCCKENDTSSSYSTIILLHQGLMNCQKCWTQTILVFDLVFTV